MFCVLLSYVKQKPKKQTNEKCLCHRGRGVTPVLVPSNFPWVVSSESLVGTEDLTCFSPFPLKDWEKNSTEGQRSL